MKSNVVSDSHFEYMFENLLKICGRFLKELDFSSDFIPGDDNRLNERTVSSILKLCPNLQSIDIGNLCFQEEIPIETIKPIFSKVKKFHCTIGIDEYVVSDDDLKNLFLLNEKLESLEISCYESMSGNFLEGLPRETLRELIINSSNCIHIDTICRVSIKLKISIFKSTYKIITYLCLDVT